MTQPQRLLSHFANRRIGFSDGSTSQKSGWVELWDSDESDLWDRGTPSAALIDWIESRPAQLNQSTNRRRLRALVPGCGRGYDVVMLALHGFDVIGLELSPKGAEVARAYAESELSDPHEYNYGDPDAVLVDGPGSVTILSGDFFDSSWAEAKFDLIYDYTFLCALHPDMRKDWARRMTELLDPAGVLVCLEFPLFKNPDEPGPPWPLQGVYWNLLAEGGDGKLIDGDQKADQSTNGLLERVDHFKPARSYPNGKGTDMVSIWCWKQADAGVEEIP
ncbi:hypothetical protein NW767_015411 [Fusarium falciforme]|nr:hypothetical protein NW767_015411 [Fusarium falciforme]